MGTRLDQVRIFAAHTPVTTTPWRDGCGGASRDRTDDLLHAMQALSQLSYSPSEKGAQYSQARPVSQCQEAISGRDGSFARR
jgi:hypothetical protein